MPADRQQNQDSAKESPYSDKEVTLVDALEHGLTEEEFQKIRGNLGRLPTTTELGMYSGLWSEHCSYKNSILHLKTLPSESPLALTKTGEENAGALDIGEGLAVVFKIESHNHPTAVEPYQGAATGVGGIMRDIFTMGARPICSLNSLRFGPPEQGRNRYLLARAVKGIGDYGNSLGIAVAGGELRFDESFSRNPLVNAMTVGIVRHSGMAFARAEGEGNPIYIVGASTGRDGIHGASFASQDLSRETEEKRSAVQVGDPFMEKLLLEATLELIASGAITGIQDMGAAGLSCSSSEMSAKSRSGMDLDLDLVVLRESGMNAYEIMLSESQERMLVAVKAGREAEMEGIFAKWGLHAARLGSVRSDGRLRIRHGGRLVVDLPAESLVLGGGAPRYERATRRPDYLDQLQRADLLAFFKPISNAELAPVLSGETLALIGSRNICSRRPLYEQYDTEVGLVRVQGPGGAAGLSRIPGTNKAIATATDCNSRYVFLDPFQGALHAVAESARSVACCGARPIGITNNLNFANPYVPENYYMFAESVRGLREACLAFGLPVTGGNVSFYNESADGPVQPSPVIGMVGVLDDARQAVSPFFQKSGSLISVLGKFRPVPGGCEYLYARHNEQAGLIPECDLVAEKKLQNLLCLASASGLFESARPLPPGGLAVALFKAAYNSWNKAIWSFELDRKKVASLQKTLQDALVVMPHYVDQKDLLDESRFARIFWFGESGATVLISHRPENLERLQNLAAESGLAVDVLGVIGGAQRIRLVQTSRHEISARLLSENDDSPLLSCGDFQLEGAAAISAFESGLLDIF